MAKLSTDELLDAFKEMTLLELSDFVKQFEETFDVTAAAPAAVVQAAPGGPAAPARRRGGEGRIRRHPRGRGREEDPGHQGGPHAHQPGPEGGQGSCRRRSQASPREGQQGGRRQGQGGPGGCRRHRHAQVAAELLTGVVRPSMPDTVEGRTDPAKSTNRARRIAGNTPYRGVYLLWPRGQVMPKRLTAGRRRGTVSTDLRSARASLPEGSGAAGDVGSRPPEGEALLGMPNFVTLGCCAAF